MSSPQIAPCDIQDLYSQHHHWLRNWLRQRLGCSHQAADLAQDTFVRVMQKQRAEPGFVVSYPRRYLNMLANSLMLDMFRRRAVEQAYLDALALVPEPELISEEERALILELLQRFDQMLDKLPAAVRQAFLLSRLDGLTYDEIAIQLDVSVRTVKRYMQQAFVAYLDVMTS